MTTTGPDDRDPPVGEDVDRAWRALSREEPPASLDASILASARRATRTRPQAIDAKERVAARRRWWPLAAAATVAAIAVGVLQHTPPEDLGSPAQQATVSDMPAAPSKKTEALPTAPAVQAEAPQAAPPAPALSAAPAPPTDNRRDREAMRQRTEARPAPPASSAPETERHEPPPPLPEMRNRADMNLIVPAPPPAASLRREVSPPEPYMTAPAQLAAAPPTASGSVASEQAAGTPAAAPFAKMAASRATDATSPARVKDSGPLPVPDWIALIRRLRDEGQTAEAAKELAAFRTAHADHEKLLPPDLRDWHQK